MKLSVALFVVLSGLSGSVSAAPGQAIGDETDSEDNNASQRNNAVAEWGSASVQFYLGKIG
jgi:hypothetical protein